jgi:ketosteroid isomerase-like protein
MPPDSWAVQPAPTGSTRFPGTVTPVDSFEKDAEDDEGFSAVDHEKWEHSRKNVSICSRYKHLYRFRDTNISSLVLYTYFPA